MCICSFVFHSLLPLDVCLCVWWPQHGSGNLSHPGVSWNPSCPQTGQANFHTFHIFHFWASLWQLRVCGTWVASWNQVPQSSRPPASPLLAGDHFCPNAFATCPKRATLLRLPPCHLLTTFATFWHRPKRVTLPPLDIFFTQLYTYGKLNPPTTSFHWSLPSYSQLAVLKGVYKYSPLGPFKRCV